MPEFSDIILRARAQSLASFGRLELQFYRLYLLALNNALDQYRPGDDFGERTARELIKEIEKQERMYGRASEVLIKRQVLEVFKRVELAHLEALRTIRRFSDIPISADFSGVSREAFENLFKRRNLGLTASYKSLTAYQKSKVGLILEKSLEKAFTDGYTWQDATQRIINGLTQGEPELRRMAKNMARKNRGLGVWLERARENPEGLPPEEIMDEEAIKRARKIAYDARRIVRTEIAHSHHEADRVASLRSEVVKGIQWNLSPRHPEPDICDVYAKTDLHGMGPGVYPPEYLPPLPHPHDLCFMTHVLTEPGEVRGDPTEPTPITAAMVGKAFPGTPRAITRTVRQINQTSLRLRRLNSEDSTLFVS